MTLRMAFLLYVFREFSNTMGIYHSIVKVSMYCRFFAKTDKTPRKRFFNPNGEGTSEDVNVGSTDQANSGTSAPRPDDNSYRQLRFLPPELSPEELLEILMQNAYSCDGDARSYFLEQLLMHLEKYPDLANKASNKLDINPLELAISVGASQLIEKLLEMRANVRTENRHLLKHIKHLLKPDVDDPSETYQIRYSK